MFKKILQLSIVGIFLFGFSLQAQAAWSIANRQFEKDGTPTFVWGIINNTRDDDASMFQLFKDTGFNTIVSWDALADTTTDSDRYANLATSTGINLIVDIGNFSRGYTSDLLPTWLSGAELTDAQTVLNANAGWSVKKFTWCLYGSTWRGTSEHLHNLTEAQKLQLAEEYYAKNEAHFTAIINSAKASNNFLGFYLIDEPKTLVAQRVGTLLSNLVHTQAPNASVFNTYTPGYLNNITPPYILEPEWIAWGDAISSDAYVNPAEYDTPVRTLVDFVTNNVGLQERRLETTDKVNWVILATDANTSEMQNMNAVYTKELQFAQTYLAIMQGAKAIIYYQYPFLDVDGTTPWFTELATHINKLGPIAMQTDITQTVTYDQPFALGYNYIHGNFPDILVKLMRNPEGQYVLLAANAETIPKTIEIDMNLFNNTTVSRLFDAETYMTTGSVLTVTLEAHGVRALTFNSAITLDNPVAISVTRPNLTTYSVVTTHDSMEALHENTDLIGQSFTVAPGQEGNLSEIILNVAQIVGGGADVECRVGQTAGQLDMSTNYSSGTAHTNAYGSFVVTISPAVPIVEGEVRAFVCQSSSGNVTFNYDSSNPHTGGFKYQTNSTDWDLTGHQSNAHDYTFSYTVETLDILRADVDQQNGINTTDASLTLRNSLGLNMNMTNWQPSTTTGDVNCDNSSNSTDALLILRESLGLEMSGTGWCVE